MGVTASNTDMNTLRMASHGTSDAATSTTLDTGYAFAKRLLDVAFSAGVIVVCLAPGIVLCAACALDTKGSPIFSETRVGRGGKPFKLYKFRTMVAGDNDLETILTPDQMEQWQLERKVDDDPRITRFGNFLRSTSIDEFPQFANVLLGQMSVIGPRAITPEEIETNFTREERELLLSVRPGISGLWQTGPRNDATFESGLRQQIELDYVARASLGLDVRLFFRTFASIFKRTGK